MPARRALLDGGQCDETREDRRCPQHKGMPSPQAVRETAVPLPLQPLPVRKVPRRSRACRLTRFRRAGRALLDRTPRNIRTPRPQATTREEVPRAPLTVVTPAYDPRMTCARVTAARRAWRQRSAPRRRAVRRAATWQRRPEENVPTLRIRTHSLRSRRCGDIYRAVAPLSGPQRETEPIRRANPRLPRAPSEANRVRA